MSDGQDEYKALARELMVLADVWKKQYWWWDKYRLANSIAETVWSRSGELQSALLYHKSGMAAQKKRNTSASDMEDEIGRLKIENWQLKGALGYEVPSDIPEGPFKCGLCDARRRDQKGEHSNGLKEIS